LGRVFWSVPDAALWLLSSREGVSAVAAKDNVLQEGRAKNVTQKNNGREGGEGIIENSLRFENTGC